MYVHSAMHKAEGLCSKHGSAALSYFDILFSSYLSVLLVALHCHCDPWSATWYECQLKSMKVILKTTLKFAF